jgi:hypothetical protein
MRKKTYKVDLTTIEGGGDFPCPKCGILFSPDDESEKVYTIIETYIGDELKKKSLDVLFRTHYLCLKRDIEHNTLCLSMIKR